MEAFEKEKRDGEHNKVRVKLVAKNRHGEQQINQYCRKVVPQFLCAKHSGSKRPAAHDVLRAAHESRRTAQR